VPTHDGLGPDDGYGLEDARTATIKPHEQNAIDPTQMPSAWRTQSKHVQLMAHNQNFCFKPPPRLEAVAHHTDEKEDSRDHRTASCSDSLPAVTPDRVFGSDTRSRERARLASAVQQELEKVEVAWAKFQADRKRDAVYGYLIAVFIFVPYCRRSGQPHVALTLRVLLDS